MPDFDPVTTILSVPAIIALVNLLKGVGSLGRWAAVAAVAVGILLTVSAYFWGEAGWYIASVRGALLGLAAAGLYDLTPGSEAPRRALTEEA